MVNHHPDRAMAKTFEQKLDAALYEGIFDFLTGGGGDGGNVQKAELAAMKELQAVKKLAPQFTKYAQFKALFKRLKSPKAKQALQNEFQNFKYKFGSKDQDFDVPQNVPGREPKDITGWNESKKKKSKKPDWRREEAEAESARNREYDKPENDAYRRGAKK